MKLSGHKIFRSRFLHVLDNIQNLSIKISLDDKKNFCEIARPIIVIQNRKFKIIIQKYGKLRSKNLSFQLSYFY